ncbi:MAG: hypothetical protein ACFCVF_17335 [Kineosporiaceae bacterium]
MSLPRSVPLAAWTAAVLAGRAGVADAVAAVVGDEEHTVTWGPADPAGPAVEEAFGHPVPDPAFLSDLLVLLSGDGAGGGPARVRLALPVPGDATGLPPAPGLLGHACDAGECVVVEDVPGPAGPFHVVAVPDVTVFGTDVDPGYQVTWTGFVTARPAPPGAVTPPVSVAEADLELRLATRDATRELERLAVAAWSAGSSPAGRRGRPGPLPPLPDAFSARSRQLLGSAAQLLAIVDAARDDPGGAVTGYETGRRDAALNTVRRAARRAVEAAVNLPG